MDALFDHINHWLCSWDFLMIVPSTFQESDWNRKGCTPKGFSENLSVSHAEFRSQCTKLWCGNCCSSPPYPRKGVVSSALLDTCSVTSVNAKALWFLIWSNGLHLSVIWIQSCFSFTLWSTANLIWKHWTTRAARSKWWFTFLVSQNFQLPGNWLVTLGRNSSVRRREACLLFDFLSPWKASLLLFEKWSQTELRNVHLMSLKEIYENWHVHSLMCVLHL